MSEEVEEGVTNRVIRRHPEKFETTSRPRGGKSNRAKNKRQRLARARQR